MAYSASQLRPDEVKAMMDKGDAYLVDVREPEEYGVAHIAGAELLPLSRFDPAAIRPPAGRQLILHCRSGVRCGMAAEALRAAGYIGTIGRMTGGLIAWAEAGLPVVRPKGG